MKLIIKETVHPRAEQNSKFFQAKKNMNYFLGTTKSLSLFTEIHQYVIVNQDMNKKLG